MIAERLLGGYRTSLIRALCWTAILTGPILASGFIVAYLLAVQTGLQISSWRILAVIVFVGLGHPIVSAVGLWQVRLRRTVEACRLYVIGGTLAALSYWLAVGSTLRFIVGVAIAIYVLLVVLVEPQRVMRYALVVWIAGLHVWAWLFDQIGEPPTGIVEPLRSAFALGLPLIGIVVVYAMGSHTIGHLVVALEREQAASIENLRLSEELDAFVQTASHDLAAPLRAIREYVQMMSEARIAPPLPAQAGLPEQQASDQSETDGVNTAFYMTRILRSVGILSSLLDALRVYAQAQRPLQTRQPVDLNTMFDNAWQELALEREGRDILYQRGVLPIVRGDRVLLRQVAMNLLGNAIKFTRAQPAPAIHVVPFVSEDGQPAVCIADNGVGFEAKFAPLLFEPFQRLHSGFEGSGVGLAIVKRIVERHGGQVWATSVPGSGASFYFSLQANKKESA